MDQVGSRLNAIINARLLAEAVGVEFRFVWPASSDRSVNDPRQLFSDAFLAELALDPHMLDGLREVTYDEFVAMSPGDRASVLDARSGLFVEINDPYVVIRTDAADAEAATRRFRRCFDELGWNDRVRDVVDFAAHSGTLEGLTGLHVRAGDIVTGAWRHVVTHQKYVPTALVHQALTALAAGERRVLLLSDSDEYLAYLRSRFPVVTPQDLVPDYEHLSETQRALADIVVLARCDPIVAPPASAFSRLAANLGGATLARTDTLAPAGEEREYVLAGIAGGRELASRSGLWRKLTAYDLCWLLDVFGDTLSPSEQHELAAEAVRLDPGNCAALSRLGRTAALLGKRRAALKATTRALAIAESTDAHENPLAYEDPLFEALASDILARSLAFPARNDRSGLERMRREYDRLPRLRPVWFQQEKVLPRLAYLIEAAQTVSAQPFRRRRRLAGRLRRDMRLPPRTIGWETDGLIQHRSRPLFDPLTRDLDRITRCISRSLGVLEG